MPSKLMAKAAAKVRSKIGPSGQATIPKIVRDALGLRSGSEVEFVLKEAGEVVMRPAASAVVKTVEKLSEKSVTKSVKN